MCICRTQFDLVNNWTEVNQGWNGTGSDGQDLPEGVYFFILSATGIDGYSYSNGLSSIGGSWTVQDLNMWLKSPKKYAPGNKMSFAGLRKTKDRANMVAFLNSISDKPIPNNGLN